MGAFLIFDIEFETTKDREKFERKYRLKDKDILVGDKSKSFGVAWIYLRNPYLNVVYNMGFMGYGDPQIILKECLTGRSWEYDEKKKKEYWTKPKKKDIIKIKFLAWLPINDKDSTWEKLRGRWSNGVNKSKQECNKCLWENKNKKCKDKYCLVNQLMENKQ